MNLHFLHGFLGLSKDWEQFKNSFTGYTSYFYSIEEFLVTSQKPADASLASNDTKESSFFQWTKAFHRFIAEGLREPKQKNCHHFKNDLDEAQEASLSSGLARGWTLAHPRRRPRRQEASASAAQQSINRFLNNESNVLVGYSLGGRLALHCLIIAAQQKAPVSWDAAVIISAHPGLQNDEDRFARLQNDEMWADRFLNDDWQAVVKDWNLQRVFCGQKNNFERNEKDFDREKISEIMRIFSLSKQYDLREQIKEIKIPVLWMAGELDFNAAAVAKEMAAINKNIKCILFPETGHRVPWENPMKFIEESSRLFLQV